MKAIEEFSFGDEPGKIQTKANIKKTIERPRISIVTPFYNAEQNFEQTYHCVINQSMQEFEWVIVDDGSSHSGAIAVLEEYSEKDARIHVIRQKNKGQSVAKNNGIRNSKADVIAFLDADDLIEPFYLETLYKALQEHPDASWSYTDLVGFEGQKYVWCKPFSAGRMTFNNTLVNAALFRKKDLEEIDCFPEKWKHYDEDWALYLKLLEAGKHPVHVPVIGFWYRRSDTGMKQTVRKNEKLRKQSDNYIAEIAKKIDIHIKGEEYKGELPQEAVKTTFSSKENLLAGILSTRLGVEIVSKMYQH